MACCLVALDNRLGVCPVVIWETLRRSAKLVMRAVGDQENTSCRILQLCEGIEAAIEGETHSVAQRQQERHAPDPEGGADQASEGAEDKRAATSGGTESVGGVETVGEIG